MAPHPENIGEVILNFRRPRRLKLVIILHSWTKKMEKSKIVRTMLKSMIFLACFIFTAYQSIQCLIKYRSSPRVTSSKVVPLKNVGKNFPAMTFCPLESKRGREDGRKKVKSEIEKMIDEKLLQCKIKDG